MEKVSREDTLKALTISVAVAEAIRDLSKTPTYSSLGGIPSGNLYARLMAPPLNLSLSQYQAVVDTLVAAELVRETPGHLLVWIGPTK